ncbi:signal transduction histidine kinase [Bellilinea caldifistulae]|uniref:ATP-binding protein n=1 Tax=Bellilinea caldifistulae TaxID=360411 RepID=UPI0007808600|nr:ATP-binding protein [Bellilinea caldifistulae]GAP11392.1 signal transduction histidine kinase [Bellilinea caldifistulae]
MRNSVKHWLAVIQKAFPALSERELMEIISAGRIRAYPKGSKLTTEGAYETTFYILLDGEVEVTKKFNENEERILKHLSAGDFFGEMAIIHDAPRAATITALTDVEVLEMEREAFVNLLHTNSQLSLAMVREVSRRLRENDEIAIAELRKKAEELSEAYRRLSQQEAARSQFLTTIAHELRTPLMVANGFLQMIRSGRLQGETLQGALDTVARNLQEITALINDILFLQEMELILPEFQPTDLGQVVLDVVETYRPAAQKQGVDLQVNLPVNTVQVHGDPKSLSRALAAVVDNAVKFSPNGGKVEISLFPRESWAEIEVRDSGVGIPPEALPYIFDRFYHLDEVHGHLFRGAGLGLSIARQVLEQHGGEIGVQSEVGRGSTFWLRLKRS